MPLEVWAIVGAVSLAVLVGLGVLWRRRPLLRWYCRRCNKIVATGRFHPRRCPCGTDTVVAYFCRVCASWNTSPTLNWHCSDCSSKQVNLGVEYRFHSGMWKWRNQNA
jgi:hypothetical protein